MKYICIWNIYIYIYIYIYEIKMRRKALEFGIYTPILHAVKWTGDIFWFLHILTWLYWFFFFFWERILLYSPGGPQIHDPTASVSLALGVPHHIWPEFFLWKDDAAIKCLFAYFNTCHDRHWKEGIEWVHLSAFRGLLWSLNCCLFLAFHKVKRFRGRSNLNVCVKHWSWRLEWL
jgi:hypothetical protein